VCSSDLESLAKEAKSEILHSLRSFRMTLKADPTL
jgi:hypothetical protein